MKIEVEVLVKADLQVVWDSWNNPSDIMQWNAASKDWHTTSSTVDLRVGGRFSSRMEAKDGSVGFDFGGTYIKVKAPMLLMYRMNDGREVTVQFQEKAGGVLVKEEFDAELENNPELQREGWQAILNNFKRHVESKMKK
jgi:uncharacterized protein YndB with AHSA1/START domain